MSARIIAFANQKGGVGKTTSCINLAACLAERNQKVLVIDFDPQANATSALGVEKQEGRSLYPVLLGDAPIDSVIVGTEFKRLDLLPSEVDLAGAEVDVARMEHYLSRLQEVLHPLARTDRYDFVFVDCPPSLGILTMNALSAADAIVLPIQCEYFALEGLSVMVRLIQRLHDSGANAALTIEGIIMTMYDARTNLSQQVVQQVVQHFGEYVYETLIPRSVRLSEAPSYGQPVIYYDRHCTGSAAYRQLAREFLNRRKQADQPPEPQSAPPVEPASAAPPEPVAPPAEAQPGPT